MSITSLNISEAAKHIFARLELKKETTNFTLPVFKVVPYIFPIVKDSVVWDFKNS